MNAGELRDWITVQGRTSAADPEYGNNVDTWADSFTDYAKVEKLRGREFFADARIAADVNTRVTMRYRDGITNKHRITFEGRVLDIKEVLEDQKHTLLEIYCKEVAP